MKAKVIASRTILVTDIKERDGDGVAHNPEPFLEITINYKGDGSASKGVTLDHFIIPAFVAALNQQRQHKQPPAPPYRWKHPKNKTPKKKHHDY